MFPARRSQRTRLFGDALAWPGRRSPRTPFEVPQQPECFTWGGGGPLTAPRRTICGFAPPANPARAASWTGAPHPAAPRTVGARLAQPYRASWMWANAAFRSSRGVLEHGANFYPGMAQRNRKRMGASGSCSNTERDPRTGRSPNSPLPGPGLANHLFLDRSGRRRLPGVVSDRKLFPVRRRRWRWNGPVGAVGRRGVSTGGPV